jgi:protein-S-isoprenylcysteine O-methyltransferase Ste14
MSRLPDLGRRGEGWVALQVVLLIALALAGFVGAGWPAAWRDYLIGASVPIALAGAYLFLGGAGGLGRQLTPFPKPVQQGGLKRGGAYRFVRHPIYGGVLLLALAWALVSSPLALVPWAIAAAFLDAKRRREEAWLVEAYPDYEEYRTSVRRSLIPFVW